MLSRSIAPKNSLKTASTCFILRSNRMHVIFITTTKVTFALYSSTVRAPLRYLVFRNTNLPTISLHWMTLLHLTWRIYLLCQQQHPLIPPVGHLQCSVCLWIEWKSQAKIKRSERITQTKIFTSWNGWGRSRCGSTRGVDGLDSDGSWTAMVIMIKIAKSATHWHNEGDKLATTKVAVRLRTYGLK